MESDLLNNIRDTNFLKESTKNEYLRRIESFLTYSKVDLKYCLENPKWFVTTVLKLTDELGNGLHFADKICSCFFAIFNYNQKYKEANKKLYDLWISETKVIKDRIDEKYESNKPTERQKAGFVSFEDIIKVRNKLKPSQERLLLFMYTEIPPVRNDYSQLRIFKKSPYFDIKNYIVISNTENYIVLNEFKTDKTYKQIRIDIPDLLLKEITESIKLTPREYLFISNRTSKKYNSANSFLQWINRTLKDIFNNSMSLTTLRHIYISRRDLLLEQQSGTKRKEISEIMGHSLNQQQKYLWHDWDGIH